MVGHVLHYIASMHVSSWSWYRESRYGQRTGDPASFPSSDSVLLPYSTNKWVAAICGNKVLLPFLT